MSADKKIKILEPIFHMTTRDHSNFFAGLAVELAKAYRAYSESLHTDLNFSDKKIEDIFRL